MTSLLKLYFLLELCREERIFRYCHLYQAPALHVTYGLGIDEHDHEGRVITLEMEKFFLVTVYTPNSQDGLKRLDYRMTWMMISALICRS